MKRRGLNRSHQFDGTDISLLVVAAFCSLVIVFIGFRCCRRKRSARKKKAAQRTLRNRGNVENGKLLDNVSQDTDDSVEPKVENSNANVGHLHEEKPGDRSKNSLASLENQNANKRSTSPTIVGRVMSSLRRTGTSESSNEKHAEKCNSRSTVSLKKGSGKKQNGCSQSDEDSLGKKSEKPGQRPSKKPNDNPLRSNPQPKSDSSVNHSARKMTNVDPLNASGQSAQLFGVVNEKKKGKGNSLSKQGLKENVDCKCTGSKCKKCAPFKGKNFDDDCVDESGLNKDQNAKPNVLGDSGTKTPSSMEFRSSLVNKDLGKHDNESDFDTSVEAGNLAKSDVVEMEVDKKSVSIETVGIPCNADMKRSYAVDTVSGIDKKIIKTDLEEKEVQSEAHVNQFIVGNPSPKKMGESKLYSNRDTDRGPVGVVVLGPGEGSVRTEAFPGQHRRKENILESIGDVCNVTQYARREWKSGTATAVSMREGYFEIPVQLGLNNLRVIRGDNYCAIRATLFQVLAKKIDILSEIKDVTKIPQELLSYGCDWIIDWNFASRIQVEKCKVCEELSACLRELRNLVALNSQMVTEEGRASHLVSIFNFKPREFEIRLLEGVKFLMLYRAIQLHRKISAEQDVPVFAMILFARDSSPDPKQFMMRHLNSVGDSGGLEQVEMHLLGYTLGITIRVVRPSHVGQPDFIASYPDDMPNGTPLITLVAEDDRHYNILS